MRIEKREEALRLYPSLTPTRDWPSLVSGAATGVSVAIRVRANDAVSGVATITVTVDGRPLTATLTPSPRPDRSPPRRHGTALPRVSTR